MEWSQEQFAKRLLALLDAHGMTQRKLAQTMGAREQNVSNWLRSPQNKPSLDVILQIADALSTPGNRVWPGLLAFGDEFEPADDEEVQILNYFRRLNDAERAGIKATLEAFAASRAAPAKKVGRRTKPQPATPPGVRPIENKRQPVNRRNELAVFPIVTASTPGARAIPRWEAVAAGFGEDLQQSAELTYIRELPYWRGIHSVIVRGDSMRETLLPGDLIIVQPLGDEGVTLPPIEPGNAKNSMRQLQRVVPHDDLFILSIDDEPPTVKRVKYSGSEDDWFLMIIPDNPAYDERVVQQRQSVRFWARVMGVGDKRYTVRR